MIKLTIILTCNNGKLPEGIDLYNVGFVGDDETLMPGEDYIYFEVSDEDSSYLMLSDDRIQLYNIDTEILSVTDIARDLFMTAFGGDEVRVVSWLN